MSKELNKAVSAVAKKDVRTFTRLIQSVLNAKMIAAIGEHKKKVAQKLFK